MLFVSSKYLSLTVWLYLFCNLSMFSESCLWSGQSSKHFLVQVCLESISLGEAIGFVFYSSTNYFSSLFCFSNFFAKYEGSSKIPLLDFFVVILCKLFLDLIEYIVLSSRVYSCLSKILSSILSLSFLEIVSCSFSSEPTKLLCLTLVKSSTIDQIPC